jgi:trehalose 6-phosphate synthase
VAAFRPTLTMLKLAICSHRGPITYRRTSAGVHALPAGPGGLVTAVAAAASRLGATWLYAASSDGDREIARSHPDGIAQEGMALRLLDLPGPEHRAHYEVISSALLAPLFHYVFSLTYAPAFTRDVRTAWAAYRCINEIFGEAVRMLPVQDAVLVEDTQLMLVGAAVRDRPNAPDVPLAYFHHVPWCEPSYFGILPEPLRHEILVAMLAYDSCGFHCQRWADAFMACCERFLPGARRDGDRVEWHGRSTHVAVIPAAIDSYAVRASVASSDAAAWRNRFEVLKGDRRLFVRVERADPSKNAVRGLRAYELLLERRPDLVTTTRLLAVVTPVRGWVNEYREYFAATQQVAAEINDRFRDDGEVVSLAVAKDAHRPDHARAVAALAVADIHVVNPTFDGLNLVAMEGAVAGDAALVLSENAGAHDLLKSAALSVNPFDIEQTADAMELAVEWSEPHRRREAARLRALVEARTPEQWITQRVDRCGRPPTHCLTRAASSDAP